MDRGNSQNTTIQQDFDKEIVEPPVKARTQMKSYKVSMLQK
jgi:hypothetical protein